MPKSRQFDPGGVFMRLHVELCNQSNETFDFDGVSFGWMFVSSRSPSKSLK